MYKELKLNKAEKMKPIYDKAVRKDIKRMYKRLSDQMKQTSENLKGMPDFSSEIKKDYFDALARQLDQEIIRIETEVGKLSTDYMTKISQDVVDDYNSYLDLILKPLNIKVTTAYSYVPTEIVTAIRTGKVYDNGWTLSKAIWGESKSKAKMINEIISEGLAQNKSSYDIAKDLERFVNPNARKNMNWEKVYPHTSKKVDYNAYRLAKTLIQHAYQQSWERTNAKDPFVTAYRWMISNSGRVCPICIDRAYSDHGYGTGIYPKDALPMDHPNGMCWFEAIMPDLDEIGSRLGEWVVNPRSDKEIDEWFVDMGWDKEFGLSL